MCSNRRLLTSSAPASTQCSQVMYVWCNRLYWKRLWTRSLHFQMKNMQTYTFYMISVMRAQVLQLMNTGNNFQQGIPHQYMSSATHRQLVQNGSLPSVLCAEHSEWQNVEKEKYIQMAQNRPNISTKRISACLHIVHMRVWQTLHNEWLYLILSSEFIILNLETWVGSWNSALSLTHTPLLHYYILFTDEKQLTNDGINNTIKSSLWVYMNVWGRVVSSTQHNFSVNLWCGIVRVHLTETFVL